MLLTGHEGEIFATKFSNDGNIVASGGFDRLIRKFSSIMPFGLDFIACANVLFMAYISSISKSLKRAFVSVK